MKITTENSEFDIEKERARELLQQAVEDGDIEITPTKEEEAARILRAHGYSTTVDHDRVIVGRESVDETAVEELLCEGYAINSFSIEDGFTHITVRELGGALLLRHIVAFVTESHVDIEVDSLYFVTVEAGGYNTNREELGKRLSEAGFTIIGKDDTSRGKITLRIDTIK